MQRVATFQRRWGVALLLGFVLFIAFTPAISAGWSTLETEHFFIHYRPAEERVAQQLAALADSVHADLTARLWRTPRAKTHVVLRDTVDMANAYASPSPVNHIVLHPVFPATSLGHLSGFPLDFDDWLRLLLTHEYAHILHMDRQSPAGEALSSIFGRVPYLTSPIAYGPPMVLEGVAVFEESRERGGRGHGAYYDMYLRTAVLADRLPPFDQVLGSYPLSTWHAGGAVYLYGYAFLSNLVEVYGDSALETLNEALARSPEGLERGVEEATGMTLDQAWWHWQQAVTERYTKQIEDIDQSPVTTPPAFETVGGYAMLPTPSPDGSQIAFVAGGGVQPAIRLWGLATGRERHLAALDAVATGSLAWHPDGSHLVVAVQRSAGSGTAFTRLVEVAAETGRVREIPGTSRAFSPTYSPHGDRLAFVQRAAMQTELRVLDRQSGQQVTLLGVPDLQILSAQWEPAGERFALSIWRPGTGAEIALFDPAGGELVSLFAGGTNHSPSWSADGRYILFDSDRHGVFNLYAWDLHTDRLIRLTHALTGLFHPVAFGDHRLSAMVYTPDGYRITTLAFDPDLGEPVASAPPMPIELPAAPLRSAGARLPARRYSPWPTLWPKFWLPFAQELAGETHLGALTIGRDVLGERAYSAQAMWGLGTGRLSYTLQWEHTLGGAFGAFGTLHDAPERADSGWIDRGLASLGVSARAGGGHLFWIEGTRTSQRPYQEDVVADVAYGAGAGWRYSTQGGRYALRTGRTVELQGHRGLGAGGAWELQYRHTESLTHASGSGVRFELAAGATGQSGGLAVGGEAARFGLRGLGYRHATGTHVARAAVEGQLRLARIERGVGGGPLFVEQLSLHPVIEAAYVREKGTEPDRTFISLGAEFGATLSLGYGIGRADWRLGIAYGWGEAGPRLYFRLASGF